MATHNWIIASGAATWQAASFDSGVLPANGDTVNINYGSADINAGLAQSAVTLAVLNVGPAFTGTAGTQGNSADFLAIGATAFNFASNSGFFKINFGSVQTTATVTLTGPAQVSGQPALQILGTHASNKLYVSCPNADSTIGVATRFGGEVSTLTEWDVKGGTVTLGAGVTQTTGKQSGGVVTTNSAATTITQSGRCTLTTQGTGAITTLNASGDVFANNRPASADCIGTLNMGPSSTVDFSTDPRPCTITNNIVMAKGATFRSFSPSQVQKTGPAALTFATQQCGLTDVTIDVGAPVTATVA